MIRRELFMSAAAGALSAKSTLGTLMTDVSNLDDLANAISPSSPKIRAYAQAQAAATQSQELEIRKAHMLIADLDRRVVALEQTSPEPPAGNVLEVSGSIAATELQQRITAAPAGPLTVRPAQGQQTFVVSGDALTLTRTEVTLQKATIRDLVATTSGAGFALEDSQVHSFLIDGANGWTIQRCTCPFNGITYGPHSGFDKNGGSIMFRANNWKILNSIFTGCYVANEPEQHTEAWFIGSGCENGLIQGCTFDDNGTTAHLFFTWWDNNSASLYPKNICVKGNTFTRCRNRYHHIDMRAELTSAQNIAIDPGNQWDSSAAVLSADQSWVRPC